MQVVSSEYIATAPSIETLPESDLPEIAVLGRSNAGKSSLINRMLGRKELAHTSSKPGKTQALQFFQVEFSEKDSPIYLVDLPGFGYAKFSKRQRTYVSKLTVRYLSERSQLVSALLLQDSKRLPGEDELAIQNLCFELQIPLTVVLTKVDRLKQSELSKMHRDIAKAFALEPGDLVLSGEKSPVEPLWERVMAPLG